MDEHADDPDEHPVTIALPRLLRDTLARAAARRGVSLEQLAREVLGAWAIREARRR